MLYGELQREGGGQSRFERARSEGRANIVERIYIYAVGMYQLYNIHI